LIRVKEGGPISRAERPGRTTTWHGMTDILSRSTPRASRFSRAASLAASADLDPAAGRSAMRVVARAEDGSLYRRRLEIHVEP
jgi:hypothetical protein